MATVKYTFNPFDLVGEDVPTSGKTTVLRDIASFVRDSLLDKVGDGMSPVKGRGRFKALSPAYRSKKGASGRPPIPNMEFNGDMLDALETKIEGNQITVSISGSEGDKAEGHNQHSKASELPVRRFIPNGKQDETWKRDILAGIKGIIKNQ